MARPLRLEIPGAVYHVLNRGNARQDVFSDAGDCQFFLQTLSKTVERHHFICHAFCLMPNHYHLLIETPEGNLSRGMRQINGMYTQGCNRRHDRVGHLFQGRYKSILVEKDRYLRALCRYVVLNPCRAGLVEDPADWAWSSYAATAGYKDAPEFLTTDWILGTFHTPDAGEAQKRYRAFVGGKADVELNLPSRLTGRAIMGSSSFIARFRGRLREKAPLKEIPRKQRFLDRPSLPDLFEAVQGPEERDSAIHTAHVRYGYYLKEIADHLGLHYTTISKIFKTTDNSRPDPTVGCNNM